VTRSTLARVDDRPSIDRSATFAFFADHHRSVHPSIHRSGLGYAHTRDERTHAHDARRDADGNTDEPGRRRIHRSYTHHDDDDDDDDGGASSR
jgi:hypothetical protein